MLDDARKETVSQTSDGEPGTEEAEALAAALNHSAERVQTLWFSFLTVMLYLTIATGTTTHRMLFLAEPLTLPVLNIPLPLFAFYILTPLIFIVFHFYMLLNLVLLARTAKAFEDALTRALPEEGEARENFRMRIENTLFAQLLVGGRLERKGINAKFLSLMALITLALAPVALILMFEVKFLPYHSEAITWLHRGVLALDLMLVWTLWPGYRSGWGVPLWPMRSWKFLGPIGPGVLSTVALVYAVAVATFPDEHMYLATNWLHWSAPVNTLDLYGEDLIDDKKLTDIIKKNESSTSAQRWVATLSLAGRDLTGANLREADVRHVDFSGATLNRANLDSAWATKALFAQAQLQGASLLDAQMQGASAFHAHLQGASLDRAQLQGAGLDYAHLQGASLNGAHLQGASLDGAQLQGADLDGAQLPGASLNDAHCQGASLNGARLQGALLSAQLQGASLESAQLQGALLDRAQLQGALLSGAQLQGASFVDVCVWRADARQAAWKDTMVTLPKANEDHNCEWTATSYDALIQKLNVAHSGVAIVGRIEQRLDATKTLEGEDDIAEIWAARERESPTPEGFAKSYADQWRELGCAAEGAPYVLHGLIDQLTSPFIPAIRHQSDAAKELAAAFLDEAQCPGAHGLSEADKAKLKKIAAPAAPATP